VASGPDLSTTQLMVLALKDELRIVQITLDDLTGMLATLTNPADREALEHERAALYQTGLAIEHEIQQFEERLGRPQRSYLTSLPPAKI
jgi:hypothetical protein